MRINITNTSPIKRLLDNPIVKKSLILISGAGFVQVFSLLTAPLITRLYTPEDFGLFAFLVSISVILSIVFPLGFSTAIVISKPEETKPLIELSFFLSLSICMFSCLIIILIFDPLFLFIPVFALLSVAYSIIYSYELKSENIHLINHSKILLAITTIIFNLLFGYLFEHYYGLIISYIFGYVIALIYIFSKSNLTFLPVRLTPKIGLTIFKQYYDFPLYQTPTNLLGLSVRESPIILSKMLFLAIETGYYFLVYRILQRPLNILSENIGQVLFQTVAQSPQKIFYYRNLLIILWVFGLAGSAILSILLLYYGEGLFGFIFGEQWSISGYYTAILSPFFISTFLLALSGSFFTVLRKQQSQLLFSFIGIFNVLIAFFVGAYFSSFEICLILFSGLETVRKISNFILLLRITKPQ